MKVYFTFKTPDAVETGIDEFTSLKEEEMVAAQDGVALTEEQEDEILDLENDLWDKMEEVCPDGETVTVELDTETGICTLVKRSASSTMTTGGPMRLVI